MDETSNKWMAYIDAEVRAACEKKGWGYQVRRTWSVRDKPVSECSVEDYEWKLIPNAVGRLLERDELDFDYYVLRLDRRAQKLVLQHDNLYGSDAFGPHFFLKTLTEIQLGGLGHGDPDYTTPLIRFEGDSESKESVPVPSQNGRLRNYLIDLTSRFKPNHFSIT